MTGQQIIDNKENIYECAKSFREIANQLMFNLSTKFNFNPETFDGFRSSLRQSHKSKGYLDDDWTYFFHGAECRFDNSRTGQIVEVIYIHKPEFGYLDGYFFYNYMLTTDRFKNLAAWFENHLNVWDAIEVLAEEGILTRLNSIDSTRNVLAL